MPFKLKELLVIKGRRGKRRGEACAGRIDEGGDEEERRITNSYTLLIIVN